VINASGSVFIIWRPGEMQENVLPTDYITQIQEVGIYLQMFWLLLPLLEEKLTNIILHSLTKK
jgi:hypothetical protein